jgi:hypothetical protein
MAKRNLDWTKEKYQRFLKEGRGQGEGKEYKSWLCIHDLPSVGRVSRIYSWRTHRIYNFFSDIETRYFYLLEWAENNIVDVKEHFPILNIEDTVGELKDTRFAKYKTMGNDVPYIISVTFLITLKDNSGKLKHVARSLKYSYELDKRSVIERYELARRFFSAQNIDFGIVTEKEVNAKIIKAKNIEWLYSALDEESIGRYSKDERKYLCNFLINMIKGNSEPIRKITSNLDAKLNQEVGTGLNILKYLIATKHIWIDMDKKIDLNKPASSILEILNTVGDDSFGYAIYG